MLIPFATRPAQPMYWRFTPAVASPAFSWPVSSIAPITRPPRRRPRRAASSSPAAANRRTSLIAASVSHDARFSSRCVRSGDRSPACWAIVHPFRFGSSLTSADTYLPACCHVSVRAKARPQPAPSARPVSGRPAQPLSWRQQPPSILLSSQTHDRQAAAPHAHQNPSRITPGQTANGGCRTRSLHFSDRQNVVYAAAPAAGVTPSDQGSLVYYRVQARTRAQRRRHRS